MNESSSGPSNGGERAASAAGPAAAAAAASSVGGGGRDVVGGRSLKVAVMSREEGTKTYGHVEGELRRLRVDLSMTAEEAFVSLGPEAMRAVDASRIQRMELEELGLVPKEHATPAMLQKRFQHVEVVGERQDLEAPMEEYVESGTGGLIFRVLVRGLSALRGLARAHGEERTGGSGGGGGGAGVGADGTSAGAAGSGGGGQLTGFEKMAQQGKADKLPALVQASRATGGVEPKPAVLGFPSRELARNDAIRCLERFGIGFMASQVSRV